MPGCGMYCGYPGHDFSKVPEMAGDTAAGGLCGVFVPDVGGGLRLMCNLCCGREAFADGAIEVSVWTAKQTNGLYDMNGFCNRLIE